MPVVNYVWDEIEDNIMSEVDDEGNTIASFTTEPELYGNVISQHRDSQTSVFHHDGIGSTIAVTDENANVNDTRAYSAFGEITESTGSTEFPFQFVGQSGYYRDEETVDYSVRARPYEPSVARWTTVDPLGAMDSANLYMYSANAPLFATDPSGLIQIISASGINVDGSKVKADVEAYIQRRQKRQQLTDKEISFAGHRASTLRLKHLARASIEGIDPTAIGAIKRALDDEAKKRSIDNRKQGEFCLPDRKKKIGVVMVGPKTDIDRVNAFVRNQRCCCTIQFLAFRDPADQVFNPHGDQTLGRENWIDKEDDARSVPRTTERLIVLGQPGHHNWGGRSLAFAFGSGKFAQQRRWNYRQLKTEGSPFSWHNVIIGDPDPQKRDPAQMLGREADRFNLVNYIEEIDEVLSVDKDVGYVCHSQGCNIVTWELERACLPP